MASYVYPPPHSAAYMRQWFGSALVEIMACRLFGAKPLSIPMIKYCQLDTEEQTSMKFKTQTLFIHENASVNIVCKIAAILSRGGGGGGDELSIRAGFITKCHWSSPAHMSSETVREKFAVIFDDSTEELHCVKMTLCYKRMLNICINDNITISVCISRRGWKCVLKCMSGSLTCGFLGSQWQGKRSRQSRHMRKAQFYVSGKRSMDSMNITPTNDVQQNNVHVLWDILITMMS